MSTFELLAQFSKKHHICDLKLSRVLLNNTIIPWVFLIPMRENITQINQLKISDQVQLTYEIAEISNALEQIFPCDRLNVAAIGNKTPQLHVHIICRTISDKHWPETVWQYDCEKISNDDYSNRTKILREYLKAKITLQ